MRSIGAIVAVLLVAALTSCNSSTPEQRIHDLLTERMQTLAVAESCTGGTIAARFTAMPGASAYFLCGAVTYSKTSKNTLLGVSPDSIICHGVVSEQVVRQMAEGIRHIAQADYAVATTGIAGPTGGTPETPVGTVWIAVSSPQNTTTRRIQAKGGRKAVINQAGTEALKLLEEVLALDK